MQIDLAFHLKYATSSRVLVGVEDWARSIVDTINATGLIQAYIAGDSTTTADLTAIDSKSSQAAHESPHRRFFPGDEHCQVFQGGHFLPHSQLPDPNVTNVPAYQLHSTSIAAALQTALKLALRFRIIIITRLLSENLS